MTIVSLQFYLEAIPSHLSPAVASAATPYVRPVSSGQQSYSTDPTQYPITEPRPKLTASLQVNSLLVGVVSIPILQASGEAQYTTDLPPLPSQLAAAFVLSTQVIKY